MKLKQYFKVLIRNWTFQLRNVKDITFLTYQVQRYNMYTIYHLVFYKQEIIYLCISNMTSSRREAERLFWFGQKNNKEKTQNSYPTHTAIRILYPKHCHFGQSTCLILFTPTHKAPGSTFPVKNYSISLGTELLGSLELARLLLKRKYNSTEEICPATRQFAKRKELRTRQTIIQQKFGQFLV